jgi:glucosamine--fructose-6-phosphate aminotransferase (isomerizing)
MMRDILDQPASLSRVIEHQYGAGRRALEEAAAALRGASRVVVTGMGASLYSAIPLAYRLQARAVPCVTVEAAELLHFSGEVARGAVVVLVSRSGETIEAVKLIPMLREMGALVIGVTNEPGTTLEREAHIPLHVGSGKDEIVAVQSYTGSAMAMALLAAETFQEDRRTEAERAVMDVESALTAYREEEWKAVLEGAHVMYVLGRGPSTGSALEGALLFHETAKLPAVAMPCGGFRHGPVEAVDCEFRAVVFASQAKTRELDQALATHLSRLGGRVRVVASEGDWFLPVTEIVPLQFAAYQAAELRGMVPGRFRHTGQVTRSETEF